MADADPALRTRFAAAPARQVLLGLRAGQLMVLGLPLAGALLLMLRVPGLGTTIASGAIALGAAALAVLPVGGRTLDQWLPLMPRWRSAHRSSRPWSRGHSAGGTMVRSDACAGPLLRGVTVEGIDTDAGVLGVIHDRAEQRLVAVMRVRGGSYALQSEATKAQALGAWGDVLVAIAQRCSAVARIQIVIRCSVAEDAARDVSPGDVGDCPAGVREAYADLLREVAPTTRTQQAHIAIAVDAGRRGAPGAAAATLVREVRLLQRQLQAVTGMEVEGALTPPLLCDLMRQTWDAVGAHPRRGAGAVFGPLQVVRHWDRLETETTSQRVFWVAQWPRSARGAGFLVPLVLQSQAPLVWSVTMEPVAPGRARRQAEAAQTAALADRDLRERNGFRTTVRHDAAASELERQEEELAAGHAAYRFSGYVCVSAADLGQLDERCADVVRTAQAGQMDLRRLDGDHEAGLTAVLPLCRGLGR